MTKKEPPSGPHYEYTVPLLLSALCVLALALRIFNLQKFDLQFDELFSFIRVQPRELFRLSADYMNSRPLFIYNLFMSYWQRLSGGAYIYRLPSAIFGTGSCLAVYFLAKEMLGRRTGIIAAFFISCSAFHLNYSQEVSPYSLAGLLMIVSFYAFLRWQSTGKSRFLVLNLACNLAGLYLIYYYAVVVLLQFCAYFIFGNRFSGKRRYYLAGLGLFSLLSLPWIFLCAKELGRVILLKNAAVLDYSITPYNTHVSWQNIIYSLKNFSAGYYAPISVRIAGVSLFIGLFCAGTAFIYGACREKFWLIIWFFFTPMLCLLAVSRFALIYTDRYLFTSMVFFYIAAAYGLVRVSSSAKFIAAFLGAGLFFIQVFSLYNYYSDRHCAPLPEREGLDTRKSFKNAAVYINGNIRREDALLHLCENSTLPLEYYYNDLKRGPSASFSVPDMVPMADMIGFIEDYFFTYKAVPKVALHDLRGHSFHIVFLETGERKSRSGIHFPDRDYERLWVLYSEWDGSKPAALLGMFESSVGMDYAFDKLVDFGKVRILLYRRKTGFAD